MAKTLRVYNGETVLKEGTSPLALTGLTPETEYNLQCAWVEDGVESSKTAVPKFTTKASTVAVTGVTVNPTETTLNIGQGADITVTVAPENATDKTFAVEGANDAIATHTISAGKVRFTGVAEGTFTATVKTTDGAKTATIAVTVNPAG